MLVFQKRNKMRQGGLKIAALERGDTRWEMDVTNGFTAVK
jgi:hypothetical protein